MTHQPETRPLPPPIPRVSPHDRRRFSSLRHGLDSRRVVIDGEDKDAYRDLVHSLAESYRPADALEEHLVVEMAGVVWRSARTRAVESRLLATGGKLERPAPAAAQDASEAAREEARGRRSTIDDAIGLLWGCGPEDYRDALELVGEKLRACWQARLAGSSTSAETYRPFGDERTPWRAHWRSLMTWLEQIRAIDDEIILQPAGAEALAQAEDRVATAMMTPLYHTALEHEARLDRHLLRTVEALAKLRRLRARTPPQDAPEPPGGPRDDDADDAEAAGDSADEARRAADIAKWFGEAQPEPARDPNGTDIARGRLNRQQRRRLRALELKRRAA